MAEEEDEALPDLRRNSPLSVRVDLGHQFLKFKTDHSDAWDLDTSDKDPQGHVSAVAVQSFADEGRGSLEAGPPGTQDISVGYTRHDAEVVTPYLEESFSFRVTEPDAVVVLADG